MPKSGAVTCKQAQERDRTADLVLTKDVLYRLSYLGNDTLSVIILLLLQFYHTLRV